MQKLRADTATDQLRRRQDETGFAILIKIDKAKLKADRHQLRVDSKGQVP